MIHFNIYRYLLNELQREPLRLWYRIVPSVAAVKEEEEIIQRKVTPPTEEVVKTKGQGGNQQRASLVDITSKRSWQVNGKDERKCKRRKRSSASEKQGEKMIQKECPAVDSLVVPSAKTIFDETRTAEFSCSTPIPSAGSVPVENTDAESNKIQNWLPKAIFDLDDRALFAKRLQRITEFQPEAKEDSAVETPMEEPIKTEIPEPTKKIDVSSPPKELAVPLRICVTPTTEAAEPEDEVHDSIGALDLSGSKGDSSTDVSSPLSAGSCRSSASPVGSASKVGPHPYFMTPSAVYHHVQQQDPAQSMAALATMAAQQSTKPSPLSSRRSEGDQPKSQPNKPIWDLFQQHIRPSSAHSTNTSQPASQSLLSLLKSNPLLFRTSPTNNNNKKKKTGLKIPPNSA